MKKMGLIVLLIGVCQVLSTNSAHAYLDPGSGSMFLQLLLGGAAGLGVILKLYWHSVLAFVRGRKDTDLSPEVEEPLSKTELETSNEPNSRE